MADRTTRFQAAILINKQILLLRVLDNRIGRSFWVIPGGGREPGETEEACVRREALEETHLEVRVDRLLLSEKTPPGDSYQRTRTYQCTALSGEARPGAEPEVAEDGRIAIVAVRWFPLFDESAWDADLVGDPVTAPLIRRIRRALKGRV